MIKLKTCKPQGYIITFTNWEKDWCGVENYKLAITNSEAKALHQLLCKHFVRYEINKWRKKAGWKPYKFGKKSGVKI